MSLEEYDKCLFSNFGITKVNTRRDSEVCSNTHRLVTKAHINMLCCHFRGPLLSTHVSIINPNESDSTELN